MEAKGIVARDEERQDELLDGHIPVERRSRKRSITIFVVVSLLNVALLALLWTQLLTPATKDSSTAVQRDPATYGDVSSPRIGKPAPDFALSALNGSTSTVRLSAFKGKPVIVNFWSSTCEPCMEEATVLQKLWTEKLAPQGVVFIGIDAYEPRNSALNFLKKYGISYLNVQDTLDGTTGSDYGIIGYPETYFINAEGVVVAKWMKPLSEQGLDYEMKKMK